MSPSSTTVQGSVEVTAIMGDNGDRRRRVERYSWEVDLGPFLPQPQSPDPFDFDMDTLPKPIFPGEGPLSHPSWRQRFEMLVTDNGTLKLVLPYPLDEDFKWTLDPTLTQIYLRTGTTTATFMIPLEGYHERRQICRRGNDAEDDWSQDAPKVIEFEFSSLLHVVLMAMQGGGGGGMNPSPVSLLTFINIVGVAIISSNPPPTSSCDLWETCLKPLFVCLLFILLGLFCSFCTTTLYKLIVS